MAAKVKMADLRNGVNAKRKRESEVRYDTPGPPPLVSSCSVWECKGISENQNPCGFNCVKTMTLGSFFNTSNLEVFKWVCHHRLTDVECNRTGCEGECRPVALGETGLGLKCNTCGEMSKGGLRGFWRGGRLGLVRMVAVVFSIITGLSYKHLGSHLGVTMNKNTWTRYLKDLGIVLGEDLERNRRTKKYYLAQADEVAFGQSAPRNFVTGKRVDFGYFSLFSVRITSWKDLMFLFVFGI